MPQGEDRLARARTVLEMEARAIKGLVPTLGEPFERALDLLLACQGHVVVTGIGKAGIIATKISATLASTGTPSFYLHPADGIHGDLGRVRKEDVVLLLSNSGESNEVMNLIGGNPDRRKHKAEADRLKAMLLEWMENVDDPNLESVRIRPVI